MTPLRTGFLTLALAGLCTGAAQGADAITCTASAGLARHVAATSTTGVERTGSYDVRLSAGDSPTMVMVAVEPRPATEAGAATKVAAPIDKVLLRSPYKSEAIAQPASFTRGASAASAVATFDRAAVRALPAGDVNVIVNTAEGERVCRIPRKDRERLLGNR
jgi:hypothetical protein